MKFILVLAALAVVALARPQNLRDAETRIVRNDDDRNEKGEYSYTIELSDGTIRHEEAKLIDEGLETEHLSVIGYFQHIGPDGETYKTEYQANDQGFNAQGRHLPVPVEPLA